MFGRKIFTLVAGYIAGSVVASVFTNKKGDMLKKDIKKAKDGGNDGFKILLNSFIDTHKNLADSLKAEIMTDENKKLYKEKKDQFNKLVKEYKEDGEDLISELKNRGEEYFETGKEKLEEIYNEKKEEIKELKEDAPELISKAKGKIKEGIDDVKGKIKG